MSVDAMFMTSFPHGYQWHTYDATSARLSMTSGLNGWDTGTTRMTTETSTRMSYESTSTSRPVPYPVPCPGPARLTRKNTRLNSENPCYIPAKHSLKTPAKTVSTRVIYLQNTRLISGYPCNIPPNTRLNSEYPCYIPTAKTLSVAVMHLQKHPFKTGE